MTGSLLPLAATRGVLSARASLYLPASVPILVPSQPPLTSERSGWADPIRLDVPARWHTSEVRLIDLVFLIDESGSMYGSAGDSRGVRRAAALSVVQLMARAT